MTLALPLIVYLCMFAAGFVFLIGAFVLGVEHDGDHDMGHDHDHDHEGADKDSPSPSIFSVKVISCFLMGFGLGATFSHVFVTADEGHQLKYAVDLLLGLIGGFAIGYLGWLIIKIFLGQQANANFSLKSWVGVEAPLNLTIQTTSCGEMTANVDGQTRSLDVRSEDGSVIQTGTLVKVIRVDGQIGIVRKP